MAINDLDGMKAEFYKAFNVLTKAAREQFSADYEDNDAGFELMKQAAEMTTAILAIEREQREAPGYTVSLKGKPQN